MSAMLPSQIDVTDEAELNAAIAALDAGQYSGAVTLTFNSQSGTIALDSALTGLALPSTTSLTIDGNGDTLDGAGAWQGLVVGRGNVTIQNLTIADAVAHGAAGARGADGGAGLGGGLFVGGRANVALSNVLFFKDSAVGGDAGGPGMNGGLGAGGGVYVQAGGQLAIAGGFNARMAGDTVRGGAAGPGGAPGAAAGAGIYLQNDLVLDPQPGDDLSIRDVIADGAGSGVDATRHGVLIEGGGTVIFAAANQYTGPTRLDGSTLLLGLNGTTGSGEIVFQGAPATLEVTAAAGPANTISGFTLGDTVELLNVNLLETQATLAADDTLTLAPGVVLRFDGSVGPAGTVFDLAPDSGAGTYVTLDANSGGMPCFVAGTRILAELPTGRAEVPVEALREGSLVATLAGRAAPVRWIGRRRIETAAHPDPALVHPIRVRAHAFGPGAPHADLLLSPDHAVLIDGALVPVRRLVNGASIAQEPRASVTYYHVELDRHDVLFAEGLAAESYLDTGNRGVFENAPQPMVLHPDLSTGYGARAGACAPAMDAADVEALWHRLAERAETLGMMCGTSATTRNPELRLLADGRTLAPLSRIGGRYTFALPRGARDLRLVSRTARPCDESPWLDDRRRMGVKVGRIAFRTHGDHADVALDDPRLIDGWHAVEDQCRRWTTGDAALPDPRGATILEVEVVSTLAYAVALDDFDGEAKPLAA